MEKPSTEIETTMAKWTTREELILAFAVKRHGSNDWDTVAMEIQSRSSLPNIFTTPHHCKLKYLDLKRRFQIEDGEIRDDDLHADVDVVPWLKDLRSLRVAELRREVHRYDDSILSLEMKVKRLEEERDRCIKMNRDDDKKPDLEKVTKENGSENDKIEQKDVFVNNIEPEFIAGESVSDGESEQGKQSVNESNSTGHKNEISKTGSENTDIVQKPDQSGSTKLDLVNRLGENSCGESSESVAKRLGLISEAKQNKTESGSSESRNLESESKIGTTATRSDVQSSASLTAKFCQNGSGNGDESEIEKPFVVIKQISAKSQPLVKMMELIRSHKLGALFERRLESQTSDKYKNVVRRHMDLRTMQKRLDLDSYSSCTNMFYRDLLLLFNNAIVFFPKSSAEFVAATEFQKLVAIEMSKQTQSSDYSPEPSLTSHNQAQSEPDPEKLKSLLDTQKASAPIIVCRKRSSISSKSTMDSNKKRELENEEKKTAVEVKPTSGNSHTNVVKEQILMNADTKDKIFTGTRSFRRGNTSLKTSSAPVKKQGHNTTQDKEAPKTEKSNKNEQEKETLASTKKRGAADFLKRIKDNSPLDKSKTLANDSKNTRQNNNSVKRIEKNEGRKDKVILRQKPATKEDISSSKRSSGGPVKKAVDLGPLKQRNGAETSTSNRPQKRKR